MFGLLEHFFEHHELQKFMLVFARMSGLVIFSPPFMNTRLSFQFKGGLVFFLAIAIFPTVNVGKIDWPDTYPELALAMIFEMIIGYTIGFAVQILFMAFQLTGTFIDRHIGFAMASLVDPQTDITVSILGSLLMNLGLFMFLDYGGHLWIIKTYAGSYISIPLLETNFQWDGLLHHMADLFMLAFAFAIQFALPVIIVITLVYVTQGFIQRTIPQLQIFVIGFIFTITLGLISVRMVLKHFIHLSEGLISHFQQEVWFIISHLIKDG